jgi:hypothetical protein
MTVAEKIEMYKEKRAFIKNISKAFEASPKGSTVTSIEYEVYKREADNGNTYFREFVVVNFFGGGKSVKNISGNSNTANLRALGTMVDGGYYDEIPDYELTQEVSEKVNLDLVENKSRLEELLAKPMNHISDVRACFEYCSNANDIEKVIRKIPGGFGSFDVEFNEDGDSFTIINTFDDGGSFETEEEEFDFYVEG